VVLQVENLDGELAFQTKRSLPGWEFKWKISSLLLVKQLFTENPNKKALKTRTVSSTKQRKRTMICGI